MTKTASDLLGSLGFKPAIKWCDGMISTHEIMETLGVSEAQAGRILRQLRREPNLETVRVRHPKTGRDLYAVIEKQAGKKPREVGTK